MTKATEIKNGLIIDAKGNKRWYKNDKLHHDNDLPAVEYTNGNKRWYKDDKRHRANDLPAIEDIDGHKQWWVNDKLHRDNGLPAIEYANGDKEYWEYGKQLTEEEVKHRIEIRKLHQKLINDLTTNFQKYKLKKI